VAARNHPLQSTKSEKYIVTTSDPIIKTANRFSLFTNLEGDREDPCGPQKWKDLIPAQTTQNAWKLHKEGTRMPTIINGRLSHNGSKNSTVAKKKKTSVSDPNLNSKEHKVKVIGDGHLKETAVRIATKFGVSSWIKPGAKIEELVGKMENDLKYLGKSDVIIISRGANDVYQMRSQTICGVRKMYTFHTKNNGTNITVVNIPHRYDLDRNSESNSEIHAFNRHLKKDRKSPQ
jgi:hypothetical protein